MSESILPCGKSQMANTAEILQIQPSSFKTVGFGILHLRAVRLQSSSASAVILPLPNQGSRTGIMSRLTRTKNPSAEIKVTRSAAEYAWIARGLSVSKLHPSSKVCTNLLRGAARAGPTPPARISEPFR
jgi:hypothetical protein